MATSMQITAIQSHPLRITSPSPSKEWVIEIAGKWSLGTVPNVIKVRDLVFAQIYRTLKQNFPKVKVSGKLICLRYLFFLSFSLKNVPLFEEIAKATEIAITILKNNHLSIEKKRRNSI